MRTLIFLSILLFSGTSFASNCELVQRLNIPEDQKVSLQKKCLDATIADKKPSIDTLKQVDIEDFSAKAEVVVTSVTSVIKTVAKDLNVAVNDFIKTPVGIITTGVIVYKFVGKDFITWLKDLLFLTMFVIVGNMMLIKTRNKFLLKEVKEETVKGFLGRDKIVKKEYYHAWSDLTRDQEGVQFWFIVTYIAQFVITIVYFASI